MKKWTSWIFSAKRILPALCLLCFGLPAIASAGPYVIGKLGYAKADLSVDPPYNGIVNDRAIAYGIDLGYDFHEHFAAEVGVTGHGGFDGHASPCPSGQTCLLIAEPTSGNHITTYTAALVPKAELQNFVFFGKVGYYQASLHTHSTAGDDHFTDRGVVLGAGARWQNSDEPWNVQIEAERFDNGLYQVTLGFGWTFNIGPQIGSR
ncbi:MAG TPA: outer membrane beta-barrel protein [Gammaproteobacteria bacterium]|nr:outer membrane beta-barrel protein [Gammaproteobacteria bacterium]